MLEDTDMRICVKCRYCEELGRGSVFACHHPINIIVDPVTGYSRRRYSCNFMRNSSLHIMGCGPDGRWWEPKLLTRSRWQRFVDRIKRFIYKEA